MDFGTEERFQSGDVCVEAGSYEFAGYVVGPPEPLPGEPETEISLEVGDIFPLTRNPDRPCYWKLRGGIVEPPLPSAEAAPEGV